MAIHSSKRADYQIDSSISQNFVRQQAVSSNSILSPHQLGKSSQSHQSRIPFEFGFSRSSKDRNRLNDVENTRVPKPILSKTKTSPLSRVKKTPIVKSINHNGGISILGQGISGLALAIAARKAGCNVTVIAPQNQPALYPLLNFRGEHVEDLVEMGVNPELFSPVSGFPPLEMQGTNTFAGPLQSNTYYGRLVSQLTQICQSLGVEFENRSVSAPDMQGIAERSGLVFVATGASRTTGEIVRELNIERASTEYLANIRVLPANQKFVSALVQVNDAQSHDGSVNVYRSQSTGGAVVALRQKGTIDSNKVWLNIQIPAEENNIHQRVAEETTFLYGNRGQVQHTTNPFTVTPKLNLGQDASEHEFGLAPTVWVPTQTQDPRPVPIILAGDATGNSGFRASIGGGVGIEQSRILASKLGSPIQEEIDTWADDLFYGFTEITMERLQVEEAVFARDDHYFIPPNASLPETLASQRMAQYAALDPLRSSWHASAEIDFNTH